MLSSTATFCPSRWKTEMKPQLRRKKNKLKTLGSFLISQFNEAL